jgi:hypothetical protein
MGSPSTGACLPWGPVRRGLETSAQQGLPVLFVRERPTQTARTIAASDAGVGLLAVAGIHRRPPPTGHSSWTARLKSVARGGEGPTSAGLRPGHLKSEIARRLAGKERQMDRDSDVVVYTAWPVSWNGIWVGTLAALAVGLIIGFIGTAVGAHEASRYDAERRKSPVTFERVTLSLSRTRIVVAR